MKNHALLNASSAHPDAVVPVDTTVSFLADRQEVIDLSPLAPLSNAGYIWSRVFQRRKS